MMQEKDSYLAELEELIPQTEALMADKATLDARVAELQAQLAGISDTAAVLQACPWLPVVTHLKASHLALYSKT